MSGETGVRILDESGNPVSSSSPLPVQAWLNVSLAAEDIQIGAVEIKSAGDDSRANVTNGAIQVNLMTVSAASIGISTITAQNVDIRDLTGSTDNIGIATFQTASIPISTITAQNIDIRDLTGSTDGIGISTVTAAGLMGVTGTVNLNTITAQNVDIRDLTAASDNVGLGTVTNQVPMLVNLNTLTAGVLQGTDIRTITATGLQGVTGSVSILSLTGDGLDNNDDYDSGVGTDLVKVIGIALPGAGGHGFVQASNPLPVTLSTGDIQIGAVELKSASDDSRANVTGGALQVNIMTLTANTVAVSTIAAQNINIRSLTGTTDNVGIATIQTASIPVNVVTMTGDGLDNNDDYDSGVGTDLMKVFGIALPGAGGHGFVQGSNPLPVNVVTFGTASIPISTITAQNVDIRDLTGSTDNIGIATIQTASIPVNVLTITAAGFLGITGTVALTGTNTTPIPANINTITGTGLMGITGTVLTKDNGVNWTPVGTYTANSGTASFTIWTPTNTFAVTDLLISVDTATNVRLLSSETVIYQGAFGTNGGASVQFRTPMMGAATGSILKGWATANSNVYIRVQGYDA